MIKINGTDIPKYPLKLDISVMDLDDSESSVRSMDGTMNRTRIAVKRQIKMEFGRMDSTTMKNTMNLIKDVFFEVYYPDPQTGNFETKTFYCANKTAGIPRMKDGVVEWSGLNLTMTER